MESVKELTRWSWKGNQTNGVENSSITNTSLKFIHIPKNAGTTIVSSGRKAGMAWTLNGPRIVMPDGNLCGLHHTPPWYVGGAPFKGANTFCVKRHPFSRLLSEYGFMIKRKTGCSRWRALYKWTCFEPRVFDGTECSPAGFNQWLTSVIDRMDRGVRYSNDCHLVPQVEYIFGTKPPYHKWCKHILPSENLTSSFDELARSYNLQLSLRGSHSVTWGSACPSLTVNSMDEKNRRELCRIYADDFALLGYHCGK